jgi:hypothetical protein
MPSHHAMHTATFGLLTYITHLLRPFFDPMWANKTRQVMINTHFTRVSINPLLVLVLQCKVHRPCSPFSIALDPRSLVKELAS